MAIIHYPKDELIEELWLPKARETKALIYPRRKKNARMSLFTLTDGINLNEIFKFEEENLIQREDSVAWVTTMIKRNRVESESIGYVLDGHIYDQSFLDSSCPLISRFPFDILNLDFGSQDPDLGQGRIEIEIKKLEKIISLQGQKNSERFLLIYTTLIDASSIEPQHIIQNSNAVTVDGWNGLDIRNSSSSITNSDNKRDFLLALFNKLLEKYDYNCHTGLACLTRECSRDREEVFSIAGIIVR